MSKRSKGVPMKPYFRAALREKGVLEILIYESIGYDSWTDSGVTAKSVRAEVDRYGSFDQVSLRINSPGGDAFEGIAIYNLVRSFGKPVTVYVDGIAASSASIIAMAGDNIVMGPNAMMMIHNPWTVCMGDAGDLRKMAEALDKIAGAIAQTYVARSQKDLAAITALMNEETWLTAQECVDQGLATSIATDFNEDTSADNMALARNFRTLRHMKHVPDALKVHTAAASQRSGTDECECECGECVDGDCAECSNEECDGENCVGCPMQRAAMNRLARAAKTLGVLRSRAVN